MLQNLLHNNMLACMCVIYGLHFRCCNAKEKGKATNTHFSFYTRFPLLLCSLYEIFHVYINVHCIDRHKNFLFLPILLNNRLATCNKFWHCVRTSFSSNRSNDVSK